jgi:hypothetical protein
MGAQIPAAPEPAENETAKNSWEAPAVLWDEPFMTTVFGLSCAKVEGIPDCIAGGLTS